MQQPLALAGPLYCGLGLFLAWWRKNWEGCKARFLFAPLASLCRVCLPPRASIILASVLLRTLPRTPPSKQKKARQAGCTTGLVIVLQRGLAVGGNQEVVGHACERKNRRTPRIIPLSVSLVMSAAQEWAHTKNDSSVSSAARAARAAAPLAGLLPAAPGVRRRAPGPARLLRRAALRCAGAKSVPPRCVQRRTPPSIRMRAISSAAEKRRSPPGMGWLPFTPKHSHPPTGALGCPQGGKVVAKRGSTWMLFPQNSRQR